MEIEELAFHSQTDKLSTFSLWIEREREGLKHIWIYINLIHLSTFHLMSAPRLVILVGRASWSHAECWKDATGSCQNMKVCGMTLFCWMKHIETTSVHLVNADFWSLDSNSRLIFQNMIWSHVSQQNLNTPQWTSFTCFCVACCFNCCSRWASRISCGHIPFISAT